MRQTRFITVSVCMIVLFFGVVIAGNKGGIPPELINSLNKMELSPAQKAIADIVANGNIKNVALNREKFIEHDNIVDYKIKTSGITNQKSSGRCWMFAALNVLRPQAMKNLNVDNFEFSQNYLMFWDKLEKMNYFLQYMIDFADRPLDDRELQVLLDGPIGDGGWWSYFVGLVDKYGMVPKEIMPETYNSSSSGIMNSFLGFKAKEMGVKLRHDFQKGVSKKDLVKEKEQMLKEIYRLLVYHLGQPPTEFEWRYETRIDKTDSANTSDTTDSTKTTKKEPVVKTFTPQSFVKEALSDNLNDYVALFNYPGKEYYKNYSFEMGRSIYEEPDLSLVNVPVDTLMAYALKSVLDSTPVWFACDVGKENYGKKGIMALDIYNYESILGTDFQLPKRDLIQMGLTSPNHAMTFMGVDTSNGQPKKWYVENSWGSDRGDKGYWYMYDDWFRKYTFGVVVQKRYLSKALVKIAKTKPIKLAPWDPMYSINRLQ